MSPRRLTPELLDSLPPSDLTAIASRADLRRLHPILGQTRLWLRWWQTHYPDRPPASLVDLGSGDGHLLRQILPTAFPQGGHGARLFFVDRQPCVPDSTLEHLRRQNWLPSIISADVADWANSAPTTELILTNLFLHHFSDASLHTLFMKISRLSPVFVAAEPRRSWAGALGSRLLPLLACNLVTQHDARVSVQAGFRPPELSALWPHSNDWNLTEHPAGLFTHFFSATKKV